MFPAAFLQVQDSGSAGMRVSETASRSNSGCLGDSLPVSHMFLPLPSLIPSSLIFFSFLHHPPVLHLLAAAAPYSTAHLS